jgi:tetratricopeptide (TPR) repeat protein
MKKYEEISNSILELAKDIEASGEWSEAVRILKHGVGIVQDHPTLKVRLIPLLAGLLWKRGEIDTAESLLSLDGVDSDEALSDFYYELGEIHYVKKYYMNDDSYQNGLGFHEKALELRIKLGDMEGVSESHSRIGTIYEHLDNWEEANNRYQAGIKFARMVGYKSGLTRPLTHLAGYQRRQGELDKAFELYHEALRVSQESGDQEDTMFSLANMAQITYLTENDLEEALGYCWRALEIAERTGFILAIARVHYGIASLSLRAGQNNQARDHFQQVINVSEKGGYNYFIGPAEEQLKNL